MKNIFSAVFLICCMTVYGQSSKLSTPTKTTPLPNSLLNLDLTLETSGDFIGLGFKTVLGSSNSGLLIGLTSGTDFNYSYYNYICPKIGYQFGILRGLYSNINFNILRLSYYDDDYGYGYVYNLKRLDLGIGYTLSIGMKKRVYLNYEASVTLIKPKNIDLSRFTFNVGFGFRLGSPAKTTYEGVKDIRTIPTMTQ